jgi:hypothetical protein
MSLGEFEPEVWIPGTHPAARRGIISLGELAGLDVIHGPRRLSTVTHDAWLAILRPPTRASTSPTRRSGTRRRSPSHGRSTDPAPYLIHVGHLRHGCVLGLLTGMVPGGTAFESMNSLVLASGPG